MAKRTLVNYCWIVIFKFGIINLFPENNIQSCSYYLNLKYYTATDKYCINFLSWNFKTNIVLRFKYITRIWHWAIYWILCWHLQRFAYLFYITKNLNDTRSLERIVTEQRINKSTPTCVLQVMHCHLLRINFFGFLPHLALKLDLYMLIILNSDKVEIPLDVQLNMGFYVLIDCNWWRSCRQLIYEIHWGNKKL